MKILVTGATGFIGGQLSSAALAVGYDVATLTRHDWEGLPNVPRLNRYFGQLPFNFPRASLHGVDAVVHCAALSHPSPERSRGVNVLGTRELLKAASEAGVKGFTFLSSQSARDDSRSPYGRTKFEAEQLVLDAPAVCPVVIRPGLVCGRGGLFGRMARVVENSPVIPVLGADALVQPVYVDDLIAGILRILARPEEFSQMVLRVGAEPGIRMRDLLRLMAKEFAKSNRLVGVPMAPVRLAVHLAERVGADLPVNSTNLTGLQSVEPMATRSDMQRLGIPGRAVAEIVHLGMIQSPEPTRDRIDDDESAKRVLLVGAGRIGIVHAVTASRLPGVVLSGVADKSPSARRLLQSIGVRTKFLASVDEALAGGRFDAAILATPPSTHLALVRQFTQSHIPVLIEKPACMQSDQLAAYGQMAADADVVALVGYLMPGTPHVAAWIERLKQGEFGAVKAFLGFSLLALIQGTGVDRWETRRQISGGGVLANSSGHVLSLIYEAFGEPNEVTVETKRIYSTEVEDAAVVTFDYGSFSGKQFSCWSMEGFHRQENRLVVLTDRGKVIIANSSCIFEPTTGQPEVSHQLDFDLGFNLAPDYAGGGIAAELQALAHPTVDNQSVMTLSRALRVERLLFAIYDAEQRVDNFTARASVVPSGHQASPLGEGVALESTKLPVVGRDDCGRIFDARDVDPISIRWLPRDVWRRWTGVAVFSEGLRVASEVVAPSTIRITVPDFLQQTRLISDKRLPRLLRSLGPKGLYRFSTGAVQALIRDHTPGFWVAATALLEGDVATIPPGFSGTILLHPYLVDLALALSDLDHLDGLLKRIARRCPVARIGIHSNLGPEAANALSVLDRRVDVLSVLASPNSVASKMLGDWFMSDERLSAVELTAEVGDGPIALHQLAWREPHRWADGAQGIMISGLAEPSFFQVAAKDRDTQWSRVFANVRAPDELW